MVFDLDGGRLHIYDLHIYERRKKMDVYEFFIFRKSVFYFCGENNKYIILHQKNILSYCMKIQRTQLC